MMTRKKLFILAAALLVLAIVLTTPLTQIGRFGSSYDAPPSPENVLNAEEINAFLEVWSKFVRKDISRTMSQISLSSDSAVPAQVRRWLYAEGWNAERFFSVEQRLRGLKNIAELQNSLEDNRRLQAKMSGAGADNLKNIVDSQERQFRALRYNPQELALVRANLYQITQVLEGKAVVE